MNDLQYIIRSNKFMEDKMRNIKEEMRQDEAKAARAKHQAQEMVTREIAKNR